MWRILGMRFFGNFKNRPYLCVINETQTSNTMKHTLTILIAAIAMILTVIDGYAQNQAELQNAVDSDTIMSDDAKNIFKAISKKINYDDRYVMPEHGLFSIGNGFLASFETKNNDSTLINSVSVDFRIYKTDDGRHLVMLCQQPQNREKTLKNIKKTLHKNNISFWYYKNGKLTKLRMPQFTQKEDMHLYIFSEDGYSVDLKEEYKWDGEKFVKEVSE